jgi:DNA mismatch repair protein MutS2
LTNLAIVNSDTYKLLELDRILEICASQAASDLGRKRISESVPSTNAEFIRRQLALVKEMAQLLEQSALPIHGLHDLSPSLKRVSLPGSLLERSEYLPLRDTLQVANKIRSFLAAKGEKFPLLHALGAALGDFRPLCEAMDHIFDPAGEIRDDASPELKQIRRRREAEARRLHEELERVLKKWAAQKITQEDEPTYRGGRLLIPVKAEHRGKVSGVIQDESASGATIFVEPLEVINIGNALRRLEGEEQREIYRLLLLLCDRIRAQLSEIQEALEILAQMDSLYGRARFAKRLKSVPPQMVERAFITVRNGRHPLLYLKDEKTVVPLSLTLGGDEGNILVITGPNAGGKTVALKTIGLFCLMAACGLHIPAEEGATLPVLDSLHCDIGDPQSLEQDLSTFTSHLHRLKAALEDPRKPKLILLDEIGSGTDPAEGSAIARASLLELLNQGALTIATTHQGTLKVFAHETPGIFNGSMEFDQETLRPTFRFRAGLPGSSYALEISARVGLPEALLISAKSFVGAEKNRLEDLLAKLNESLRLSETARREAELKRVEMESLRKMYSDRIRELSKSEKERLQKAAQEAKDLLEKANQRIEAEVRAIREQQASRPSILQAHRVIKAEKEKIDALIAAASMGETPEVSRREATPKAYQVGDWVKMADLKDAVRILALKKDGQEALLEVGGLHLWMDTAKLQAANPPTSTKNGAPVKISLSETSPAGHELDLRGMTGDEAAFAVEKYLDDCLTSGWKSVRIIHGKGTGALRTRVREVLSRHPHIKSVRYGRPEEGEFGVTVVELE